MLGSACALLVALSHGVCAQPPIPGYPDPKLATEDLDIKVVSLSKRITEDNDTLTRWDVEVVADVRARFARPGPACVKGLAS